MKETIFHQKGWYFLVKRDQSGHYYVKTCKPGKCFTDSHFRLIKAGKLAEIIGLTKKDIREQLKNEHHHN